MEWISQNWVWVLFFVAFVAVHLFGHGGHGGHRGGRAGHGCGRGGAGDRQKGGSNSAGNADSGAPAETTDRQQP